MLLNWLILSLFSHHTIPMGDEIFKLASERLHRMWPANICLRLDRLKELPPFGNQSDRSQFRFKFERFKADLSKFHRVPPHIFIAHIQLFLFSWSTVSGPQSDCQPNYSQMLWIPPNFVLDPHSQSNLSPAEWGIRTPPSDSKILLILVQHERGMIGVLRIPGQIGALLGSTPNFTRSMHVHIIRVQNYWYSSFLWLQIMQTGSAKIEWF